MVAVAVRRMAVIRVTVAVVTMAVAVVTMAVAVMTVTVMAVMVVFRRCFREDRQRTKGTGQLSRPAHQSHTGQHGHVDELTREIADRHPQQIVLATFRRSHTAPDQHRHHHQQQHSQNAAPTQNRISLRPVHCEAEKRQPRQQRQPWYQDQNHADHQIQQGLKDIHQTGEKVEQGFHDDTSS